MSKNLRTRVEIRSNRFKAHRLLELSINNQKSRSEDMENVQDILLPACTEEKLADLLN